MIDRAANIADDATAIRATPAVTDGQHTALPVPGHGPHATETRRLYAADWAAFAVWCRARDLAVLPASSATVTAYLGSLSATLKPGAPARRAAAIADRHRRQGHPSSGTNPAVRAVRRAPRQGRGARSGIRCARRAVTNPASPTRPMQRRAPPGPAQLARMVARCPGNLAGLRDRALLLSAAGLDAERLLALDREHVRFTVQGAVLAVPGAGSGGEGEGVVVARLASPACPVRALQDWLGRSDAWFGPVFRKVDR